MKWMRNMSLTAIASLGFASAVSAAGLFGSVCNQNAGCATQPGGKPVISRPCGVNTYTYQRQACVRAATRLCHGLRHAAQKAVQHFRVLVRQEAENFLRRGRLCDQHRVCSRAKTALQHERRMHDPAQEIWRFVFVPDGQPQARLRQHRLRPQCRVCRPNRNRADCLTVSSTTSPPAAATCSCGPNGAGCPVCDPTQEVLELV